MIFISIFHGILFVINKMLETLTFVMVLPYYFKTSKKCPPLEDEILLCSASKLAERIRRREITCQKIIQAYISRIREVNPILNAIVEERFAEALIDAKEIDAMLKATSLSSEELKQKFPLLGLPITVKGSMAVKGLDHGAGRVFPNGKKATRNAHTVQLIKEAGAILLLVSNTPELCMTMETYNNVTGITNNPFDTRKTPGGSSGGEAALIGAGASLIGLGSDLLGSIRLPAHYCGIWGHKPTAGVVSNDGHYPDSRDTEIWNSILTVGPMSRYSEDLHFLYQVIAEKQLNLEQVQLRNLNYYFMENDGGSILTHAVQKDILRAIRKFIDHLETKFDLKVQELNFDLSCVEIAYLRALQIGKVDTIFDTDSQSPYTELLRLIAGKSKATYMPIVHGILHRIVRRLPAFIQSWPDQKLRVMKNELLKVLGSNGILLYPTHPRATHFHGDIAGRIFDYHYTGIFNGLGLPATHCPVGLNSSGLPIGFQIVAAPNNDHLTLAVAREVETVFGGWVPPSL